MNTWTQWEGLLAQPGIAWEGVLLLAVLGAAAALAWFLARRRERDAAEVAASVMLGDHGIDGALFPALALALAWGLKWLLPLWGLQPGLVRLALPLLVSLLLIRVVARVLRAAWPDSRWAAMVERSVSWLAWGGSVLWVTGLWPLVWGELESHQWKLGGKYISLATMLEASFSVVLVMVVALWLSAAIESRLLRGATGDDISSRKIVANLAKALLLFVGLLVALTSAGIDLTALSVLGGALGVGIGFGLQKLASNYVSGFVILAERSLRIGDMVRVDGFEGRITDIKTRYTVIRALNGRESIVPNELLITQRVENSSLADPKVALSATVSVPYDADLATLMPALQAAVQAVPRIQTDPPPSVQLSQFGADGLELTVVYWIADPENGAGSVRSDVNLAVLALLRERGVDIPYPQRVLHQR
ncbi:mechanosensitive ion channel family protein [Inhella crocodyli]|uniref:Mechanosensitive ion channel n=1 Tax=Inhella crocodyli TaxID=2499851 RepID=A0A3S2UJK3_9BURK|nr:mechanosensitive ion channel domain-containing protein [Inhella crocodyli]RVT87616.1 mechanosensitive ion channel [Inhella crocodyli]